MLFAECVTFTFKCYSFCPANILFKSARFAPFFICLSYCFQLSRNTLYNVNSMLSLCWIMVHVYYIIMMLQWSSSTWNHQCICELITNYHLSSFDLWELFSGVNMCNCDGTYLYSLLYFRSVYSITWCLFLVT